MNVKLANAVVSTRNFVVKHKTAIAVAATAATCIAVHVAVVKDYNEFLKEHNLFDKYFRMDELDIEI